LSAVNPKVEGERIKNLMVRVENGDIKIPKFQRNFVWKQKSITNLLDSIYKGYPIGSLLFWCTKTKIKGERNIGGYELQNTKDSYPTNYVLDGQQRLTTIYSVFVNKKDHPGMNPVFDIGFDLNTKQFVPTNAASCESIPLHALFDNKEFLNVIKDFSSEDSDLASDLQETFMNYEVPIVTVNNGDIEEVSIIFERINSTAKTLTVFDLMVAATWSEHFDLRDEVTKLQGELKTKNFGALDAVTLLKCFAVVLTGSQNRKAIFSLRDKSGEIVGGIQKAKYGLFRAVDFIATEFFCPSSDFLPYDFQLVLLTYFFANVSIPKPQMIELIKRWFWKSSFAERYQGANDTVLEKDISDCKKLIEGKYDDIFDFEYTVSVSKIMKTEFKKGTAFSNSLVCMLANKQPRNLLTGTKIDVLKSLSKYNRKEFHHIFPTAYLKDKDFHCNPNSVCNIIVLSASENKSINSKAPSTYFAKIKEGLPNDFQPILLSNYIPSDDCSGIWEDDYDFFAENRAELLKTEIEQFIK
jgi:Uncharacterized conserved protein